MQLETKSGENKGGSKLGTLRYRSWRTRITESPNTGLIMTAPCDYKKKHLGFTKNCQNLRPQFLEDKPDLKAASKWTKNHRQMWKKFVGKVMWFGGSWICQHSTLAVTGEDVISHSMPFSWVRPTHQSTGLWIVGLFCFPKGFRHGLLRPSPSQKGHIIGSNKGDCPCDITSFFQLSTYPWSDVCD